MLSIGHAEIAMDQDDPSQIDQIPANLCINARDAITWVGKLTIETENISFDEDYCADSPSGSSNQKKICSVARKMRELTRNVRLVFDYLRMTSNVCRANGL